MILLLALGCLHRGAEPEAIDDPHRLVIAHTNDLHTYYVPTPVSVGGETELWGGFERIDGLLQELRETHGEEDLLYLDAGDLLTGTPLMEFEHRGVQGGAMLDLISAVGCDAMVLGNHEFDRGLDNVAALIAISEVPILSANLVLEADLAEPAVPGLLPHVILDAAGEKIGVFGLTTYDLPAIANPSSLEGVEVRDPIDVAREQVEILAPQVDRVVALTHIGLEPDRALAAAVPGIDLIVGGHSHTAMDAADEVGETWIVQSGQYARNVGVAMAPIESGGDWSWERVDLRTDVRSARPEVSKLVDFWDERVVARFGAQAGTVESDLRRKEPGQSSMGRWASDLVRLAAQADVGIYNRGGLREDLEVGDLTLLDLYRVFPFGNEVVHFSWTGAQLETVVSQSLRGELNDDPAPLQWSGIRYHWLLQEGNPTLVELYVGDEKVDQDAVYRIATNVFVSWQWENLLAESPGEVEGIGLTVFEAATEAAAEAPIRAPADRRSHRLSSP
jgi:2',3'-cyclic-nucleotide 2'-phosphodiesterase (5'-nucleotidase family)